MKKTRKKVFGCFGLAFVAATTVFAATLPNPNVSAVSGVTDTIVVRVEGSVPDVNFVTPSSDTTVIEPKQNITFNWAHMETVSLSLKYTNEAGEVTDLGVIYEGEPNFTPGEYTLLFDFAEYGYGAFEFVLTGVGRDGVPDTDVITITYEEKKEEKEEEVVPVPDTGTLLGNLNITKEDYVTTGLIIFSLAAIAGFAFIAKSRKASNKK